MREPDFNQFGAGLAVESVYNETPLFIILP